jgi:glutamine synthetase
MTPSPRQSAVRAISSGSLEPEPRPHHGRPLTELYGENVFNDAAQRKRLPKPVYRALRLTIEKGEPLDANIADAVANAMKDWAIERGATHYTHWFQPMTGSTAEKHDSFLSPTCEGGAILEFSGTELIQGEPDASSFPSGGLRGTFEARGYTAWDPTSPAYLRETRFGVTLTIPTAFASWTGEALDMKTPLLRSCQALDGAARRLLKAIGDVDIGSVFPTVGPEQEYFLIDREFFYLRPDLVSCGRTLFGASPPKGQELEDHYFGATPQRVLTFMMDLEYELWKLGIPVKTRHAEVAPSQFEMAPIFEPVTVAMDHSMLAMEMLQVVAERHGLKCLLHEKPFAGVNGSGKHNNWSIATNTGENLLEPGDDPHSNLRFVVFLTAIIRSIDTHPDLLRASIAHAGNDHRLGANEAPPAIISIFLGSELEGVVEALIKGSLPRESGRGDKIQLGVTTLPPLPKHTSDRNRTSPFAFTGNKFEFRALGSSQSLGYPNTFLNTVVAESCDFLTDEIQKRGSDPASITALVRETLTKHQRILFSGDNYTKEWQEEAGRRGLLNLRDTPAALEYIKHPKNTAMFERYGVFTPRELESRYNVMNEQYVQRINVEALAALDIASTMLVPGVLRTQRELADSIAAAASAGVADLDAQRAMLERLSQGLGNLQAATETLRREREACASHHGDPGDHAKSYRARVVPAQEALRQVSDELERIVHDEHWPLPKYRELLFIH